MWQHFSPTSRAAILRAQEIALEWNQSAVSPACLFLALLESAHPDSRLGALLLAAGLEREDVRLYVESNFTQTSESLPDDAPVLTLEAKRAVEMAADEARQMGMPLVEPEHLLFACLHPKTDPALVATLASLGWDLAELRAVQRQLNARSTPRSPLEMLTGNAQKVIEAAYAAMRSSWCGRISTAHLLLGILQDDSVLELLAEVGISPDHLKTRTRAEIRTDSLLATPEKRFDKSAKRALDRAKTEAITRGHLFIGPEHILLALLPQRPTLREKLRWGAQMPDIAASALAETEPDIQKLRDYVGPRLKNVPRPPKVTSPDVPPTAIPITFGSMLVAGAMSSYALFHTHRPALPGLLGVAAMTLFLALLLATSLGACWMLITSRKPNLKSAWAASFFGFLLGIMIMLFFIG